MSDIHIVENELNPVSDHDEFTINKVHSLVSSRAYVKRKQADCDVISINRRLRSVDDSKEAYTLKKP